jgi:hypothetical protein
MLCKIEIIEIIGNCMIQILRPIWGKGPNPFLLFCLRAAREKLYGMPKGLNYCVIFVVCIYICSLKCGRGLETHDMAYKCVIL